VVKAVLACWIGGRALALRVVPPLALAVVAGIAVVVLR
jgi:hypothetical protein